MRITDEFKISDHYYGPVGHYTGPSPSVSSKPIQNLIDALSKEGVEVSAEQCSMDAAYRLGNEQKQATLPLDASIPGSSPGAYLLRGPDNLEIRLEDYDHVSDRPPEGMIGGTVSGHRGIPVTLSVESADTSYVDRIREAVRSVYDPDHGAMKGILGSISKEDLKKLLPEDKKED